MRTRFLTLAVVLALPFTAACGATDEPPGGGGPTATGAVLPWKVGNNWTYRVTDDEEGVTTKVTTIEEETTVGGDGPHKDERAYRVVTKKKDGADQTISWQIDEGDRVLRYREQSFSASTGELALEEHWDPYKLHIDGTDEHTESGATWLESYAETKEPVDGDPATANARDVWTVDGVGVAVTVPAGTFSDCIVYIKAGGDKPKTYWYQRSIGKIKETGTQTEELTDYELEE